MSIANSVTSLWHRVHCARKRRALIADLSALNDRQLDDIGLWRGAIPDTAAQMLAQQGCPGATSSSPN